METTRFTRIAGVSGIIGALFFFATSFAEFLLSGSTSKVPHNFDFIFDLLLLAGLVGLAGSGAVGKTWLGKIGLGLAILGRFLFIPAGLALLAGLDIRDIILPISSQLLGLGMVLAGIAVLQAKHWQSWRKFTPLLCGLYPFLVLLPAFAISGGPNYPAIAGWDITWLLLNLALWIQSTERQVNQPVLKTLS